MSALESLSAILPDTAAVSRQGHLTIGGCDVVELASELGTPLYVFDEATLRRTCAEYRREFSEHYADSLVIYAAKAFINRAVAQIMNEEGLGLDVVSGGELSIARSVDFPMEKVYFHGNNKLPQEIALALSCRIGRFVVDNLHELAALNEAAGEAGIVQRVLLRLAPGIDAHTHRYVATGIVDSKFGLPLASGQAEEAVVKATAAPNIELVGLHVHLGSLIFSAEPYQEAIRAVFRFAAEMTAKHGFSLREFSPGGGFAIQYTRDAPAPDSAHFAGAISGTILSSCGELGLSLPRLIVEPGRAIVGRSAVAVYRAGAPKEIPGIRRYIAVDGGMADNIRPALYDARYEALVANKVTDKECERVTIAGRFCESGDILVRDVELPRVVPGDTIVIPGAGAYCLPLASNYNAAPRPAVVMVREGKARLIRRRETYDDLMRNDIV